MHHVMGAHPPRGFDLSFALHYGDYVTAHGLSYVDEHQTNRPSANHGHRVTNLYSALVQTAQHAGQRLDHGRFLKTDVRRNGEHVEVNDAPWNADVLGIGTVVEEKIFAEIFLMTRTIEAHLAGRRVQRNNPHAC